MKLDIFIGNSCTDGSKAHHQAGTTCDIALAVPQRLLLPQTQAGRESLPKRPPPPLCSPNVRHPVGQPPLHLLMQHHH